MRRCIDGVWGVSKGKVFISIIEVCLQRRVVVLIVLWWNGSLMSWKSHQCLSQAKTNVSYITGWRGSFYICICPHKTKTQAKDHSFTRQKKKVLYLSFQISFTAQHLIKSFYNLHLICESIITTKYQRYQFFIKVTPKTQLSYQFFIKVTSKT